MANIRQQTHTFTVNYLFAIDAQGGNRTQGSREGGVLARLFLPADQFDDDDGSSWLTPPDGFEVEEVNVTSSDRRTDYEEHNLGWWEVVVEIKGHTYNTWPTEGLGASVDARVYANRTAFTPDLALVAPDDYWHRHIEDLANRLPCVITQDQAGAGQRV